VRLRALADGEHLLEPQRLEIETVRGVVVGRHRLRVAVDHNGLVTERAKALRRVHAAVVELDSLADPVWPGAEDDGPRLRAARRRLVGFAVGGVVVRRRSLDLAGARVDTPVGRQDAAAAPL